MTNGRAQKCPGARHWHDPPTTTCGASADLNGLLHSTDGARTWTFVPDYYRQAAALTPAPTPLFIVTPPPTP